MSHTASTRLSSESVVTSSWPSAEKATRRPEAECQPVGRSHSGASVWLSNNCKCLSASKTASELPSGLSVIAKTVHFSDASVRSV